MEEYINFYSIDKNSAYKNVSMETYLKNKNDTFHWIHVTQNRETLFELLTQQLFLDPVTAESLTAEETRPRSHSRGRSALIILRGVNLNPGSTPEDMVSIRIWVEPERVITVQNRKIMAVGDIIESLEQGLGPNNPASFLCDLCENLYMRMSEPLENLDDSIDELEEKILENNIDDLRSEINSLRRKVITLRRYLHPQRDALVNLSSMKMEWLDEKSKIQLLDSADRITRHIEDLNSGRERTAVARDELDSITREKMSKIMYVFSIITVLFLPLGLVTGLLGINVGGIPGAANSNGFYFVCLILLIILFVQFYILKKIKLL